MTGNPGAPKNCPRFDLNAGIVVFIALALAAFGLVIQTSAGQYMRGSIGAAHDPLYTFRMQLIYFVPALCAGIFFLKINLCWVRRHVWKMLAAACVLLLCARFAIPGVKIFGSTFPGVEVNGSWRWINLGVLRLQASDIAKVTLVFAMAHYLAGAQRFLQNEKIVWLSRKSRLFVTREAFDDFFCGFFKPCLIIALVCGLIAIEPDLGTTALCGAIGFLMLFLSGGRLLYIVPAISAGIAAFSTVVYFWPNRLARVLAFLDPEGTKLREGYQLWQALVGFGCGGFKGVGLGDGMQYRYFLPEAHTDFVFAVVGEEFGFVRAAAVVLLFLVLLFAVVRALRRVPDVYCFNLCFGSALFIVLQALVNMGVVTGLLPTKGMSLPFVSYGGSNLVVMFSFVGITVNAMHNWRESVFPQLAIFGDFAGTADADFSENPFEKNSENLPENSSENLTGTERSSKKS